MNCSELEQFLYPYLDGEFTEEERREVELHLASCRSCASRMRQEAEFVSALRLKTQAARGAPSAAPASLRAGIQRGLRRQQWRQRGSSLMRVSAAAMVAVALGGLGYQRHLTETKRRHLQAAAQRHARAHPLEIVQVPAENVEAWFGGKLDHHVRVPRLPNAVLAGARLSHVEDKQAAYIRYDAPSTNGAPTRRIGLFVFDDASRDVSASPLPQVAIDTANGFNVAVWRDGEIVYELVSDLDEADIRRMLLQGGGAPKQAATAPAMAAPRPAQLPTLPVQTVGFQQ